MIRDPALRFFVDYVESEGALCDAQAETVELILPSAVQRLCGFSELLTVTSDPDIAEDDGALLLALGHPALDAAAARVIERGDVGRAFVNAGPTVRMPRESLLSRARAEIAIDHGRIDAAGDPVPVYYPLLRVGALITYTLDDRFQECEEVWVDAYTGAIAPRPVVQAIRSQAASPERDGGVTLVPPDFTRAVAAAHAALDARAAQRALALERQARLGLRDEQQRTETYYAEVLAALEGRRASAPPERRPLLEERAAATERERRRRLREIAEKFTSSRTIAPYRLNLLFVRALAFFVEVRRGDRRYPYTFHWLPASGCFAPPACPNCARVDALIAGRTRLTCRSCPEFAAGFAGSSDDARQVAPA